jgi:hypothetical protein
MRNIVGFVFILLLFASCGNKDIALNLEKGKEYTQKIRSKSNITQGHSNREMNMMIEYNGEVSYTVKSVENDSYILEAKYLYISMTGGNESGLMKIGSDIDNPDDLLSKMLKKVIGDKFEVKIDRFGKVLSISGLNKVLDRAIDEYPEIDIQQREAIRFQLSKPFSKKSFKSNFELCMAVFPESQVKVGDTWNVATELGDLMYARINTEYKLVSIDNDIIHLEGNSDIVQDDNDKQRVVKSGDFNLRYSVKGKVKSTIKIDANTGWIVDAEIDQDINGETYMSEKRNMSQAVSVPVKVKSKIKINSK